MATWSQRVLAQGRKEGRQEGVAELLLIQLSSRFGPQSDAVNERVRTASSAQLEQWAKNILDAGTIEEVFRIH